MNFKDHVFNNHLLKTSYYQQEYLFDYHSAWQSILLIICLVVFVYLKNTESNRLVRIVQAVFNDQVWGQVQRDDSNRLRSYSILLIGLYIISIAFLSYKLNKMYPVILANNSEFAQFMLFLVLFSALSLIKLIVNKTLIIVSNHQLLINEYTNYNLIINQSFSLILLPLVLLTEFVKLNPLILIAPALILFALNIMLKWLKGIRFALIDGKIGILQSFVYLCAIEILPILVLGKLIIEKL